MRSAISARQSWFIGAVFSGRAQKKNTVEWRGSCVNSSPLLRQTHQQERLCLKNLDPLQNNTYKYIFSRPDQESHSLSLALLEMAGGLFIRKEEERHKDKKSRRHKGIRLLAVSNKDCGGALLFWPAASRGGLFIRGQKTRQIIFLLELKLILDLLSPKMTVLW